MFFSRWTICRMKNLEKSQINVGVHYSAGVECCFCSNLGCSSGEFKIRWSIWSGAAQNDSLRQWWRDAKHWPGMMPRVWCDIGPPQIKTLAFDSSLFNKIGRVFLLIDLHFSNKQKIWFQTHSAIICRNLSKNGIEWKQIINHCCSSRVWVSCASPPQKMYYWITWEKKIDWTKSKRRKLQCGCTLRGWSNWPNWKNWKKSETCAIRWYNMVSHKPPP